MLGYTISDGNGVPVLQFFWNQLNCYMIHEFPILDVTGENEIGKITKEIGATSAGSGRYERHLADHFEVNFPVDMDVRLKAACIAAAFFIVSKYSSLDLK